MNQVGHGEREAARALLERLSQPQAFECWRTQTEAALARHPEDLQLLRRRAGLLRGLGHLEQAEAAYAKLAERESAGDAGMVAEILAGRAQCPAVEAGPSRFVRLEGVFEEGEIASIWQAVRQPTAPFEPARVGAGRGNIAPIIREAALVKGTAEIRQWFWPRIERIVQRENILARLGIPPFDVAQYELQITRHAHGGFYAMHKDSGGENTATAARVLTYVFYFHSLPRLFTGGDLLLFDQNSEGARDSSLDFTRLSPQHNSIIFFASDRLHAVTRVACPSPDPHHGRWTVNGWLHRRICDSTQELGVTDRPAAP
jgi:hypothetical protein